MEARRLVEIACLPEPLDGERLREIGAVFEADPAMREKTDTSGGTYGAIAAATGGAFFRIFADGEPVAWYVLQPCEGGIEIALAYGRADFDLTGVVLPVIERQCVQFGAIRIETKRRGLMRKLQASGYIEVRQLRMSVVMEKKL